MNGITFLGEDDFIEAMNSDNKKWRDEKVRQGTLKTKDGINLNYYYAKNDEAKGVVIFVHGFCEFWGKYHEYAWYVYRAGYSFYFLEQRGFGLSEGKTDDPDIVYIDDFNTYVADLKLFLDEVMLPASKGLKKVLIAHSMGGAVSALFLGKHEGYFDSAILSTPMLKMKNDTPLFLVKLLNIYAKLFNKKKDPAPGQSRFSSEPDYEDSCSLSRARFDYVFEMRLNDERYQTNGASLGWALAAFKSHRQILRYASNIKLPVTILTAGLDTLIDDEGYKKFALKVPQTEFIPFNNSKHEIFNAADKDRIGFFKEVLKRL